MAVRFFMLQSHYSSTLDFSNEALQASEKGFYRLMEAIKTLNKLKPSDTSSSDIAQLKQQCYDAMNDDFNSPVLIAHLFDGVRIINSTNDGKETISETDLKSLKKLFYNFVFDILGLKEDMENNTDDSLVDGLLKVIIELRKEAKEQKNFAVSDKIRNELTPLKITLKDAKDGSTSWIKEN